MKARGTYEKEVTRSQAKTEAEEYECTDFRVTHEISKLIGNSWKKLNAVAGVDRLPLLLTKKPSKETQLRVFNQKRKQTE